MKICIISDTHGKHKQLKNMPDADVIIHAGDITTIGKEREVRNFLKWYASLDQYQYKIFISGNHDWLFERNGILARSLVREYNNITYLEDTGIEILGINFYGTPVSKPFCDWAFNRHPDKLIEHWKAIPDNTDVLITHTPPKTILDYVNWQNDSEGSPTLRIEVLERIKPKIHCFGHIHEGYGRLVIDNTTFINASNLDRNYDCVNEPNIIEI
jgi:Icc-related predicted phosphoesterase